jgi:hypothetical protein
MATEAQTEAQEVVYCTYHPNVPTTLRCARCGKPICAREAVLTEVGYRCPDCVRERKATFYTGAWYDYIIAAVISLPLAFIAAAILTSVTLIWFFVFFLAPMVGGVIAEAVRWAVRRRRSRYLWVVVCAAIVLSALPGLLGPLLSIVGGGGGRGFIGLLSPTLYLVLATAAAYARLKF